MYGQGNISYNRPSVDTNGGNPPGVTDPFIGFTVGDGQTGTPVNGQTFLHVASLQGQSLVNKRILVVREGIYLNWNTPGTVNELRRYNSGGLGGWTFEGGFFFITGERYQIYIIGTDTTVEV